MEVLEKVRQKNRIILKTPKLFLLGLGLFRIR